MKRQQKKDGITERKEDRPESKVKELKKTSSERSRSNGTKSTIGRFVWLKFSVRKCSWRYRAVVMAGPLALLRSIAGKLLSATSLLLVDADLDAGCSASVEKSVPLKSLCERSTDSSYRAMQTHQSPISISCYCLNSELPNR